MNSNINVPGYRILRPLGEGGMASVFLALQESLEREVALKVMSAQLVESDEFTQRFLKEGKITAKMSHPNLVTVYDIGQVGETYYLATEYIPGGTLRDRMNRGIGVLEALDVARDVAAGLAYAHDKGVVHRDVKPGNVLFKSNGTAVLADFGIAKSLNSRTMATQAGNSIGTPHYMSPEQARAEAVDGRSDLYSLGAMLFEVLVGKPPYQAGDPYSIALMHVTNPVPEFPKELAWLQPVLSKLMAKDPNNRFATGDAFITALDDILATAPEAAKLRDLEATKLRPGAKPVAKPAPVVASASSSVSEQTTTQGRGVAGGKPAWFWPAVAAASLIVAGGAWWAMQPKQPDLVIQVEPVNENAPANNDEPVVDDPANLPPITDASITDAAEERNGNTSTEASSIEVENNDPASEGSTNPPKELIDPDSLGLNGPQLMQGRDVANLVKLAEAYMNQGLYGPDPGRRIESPPGDNAIDLFQRVLQLDASNQAANKGLRTIADHYATRAKDMLETRPVVAQVLYTVALRALPNDPKLIALEEVAREKAGFNKVE